MKQAGWLSAEDLTLIRTKRRPANRLGFAIQLCVLRHSGRVLDPAELPPEPMLAFIGKQVDTDPALFGEYARRAETRREHITELQKLLRLRSFGLTDWRSCLKAGFPPVDDLDRAVRHDFKEHLKVDFKVYSVTTPYQGPARR